MGIICLLFGIIVSALNPNNDFLKLIINSELIWFMMEISIKWNVCRLCLQEDSSSGQGGAMKSIYKDSKMIQQILECAGIEITLDDSLPDKICHNCLLSLRNAIKFRNTCRSSNKYLQTILEKTKSATSLFKLDKLILTKSNINKTRLKSDKRKVREEKVPITGQNLNEHINSDKADTKNRASTHDISVFDEEEFIKEENVNEIGTNLNEIEGPNYILANNDDAVYSLKMKKQHKTIISDRFMLNETNQKDIVRDHSEYESLVVNDPQQEEQNSLKHDNIEYIGEEEIQLENDVDRETEGSLNCIEHDEEPNENELYYILNDKNDKYNDITIDSMKLEDISEASTQAHVKMESDVADINDYDSDIEEEKGNPIETVEYLVEDTHSIKSETVLKDNSTVPHNKTFIGSLTDKGYKKHVRKTTGNANFFVCEICGNGFTNRSMLNYHMRVHRNEKNFECEICFKRFNASCNLNAHMRTHTGEKPFECRFCGRRFTDRSTHIKHERIHTNEKPFSCNICKKSFSLSTSLRAHERIHTGEKPYKCEPCAKAFKLSHQLKAHYSTNLHKHIALHETNYEST